MAGANDGCSRVGRNRCDVLEHLSCYRRVSMPSSLSRARTKLRSATYFIKNSKKELVGMLTINFSVSHLIDMRDAIDALINGFDKTESRRLHHEPDFFEVLRPLKI